MTPLIIIISSPDLIVVRHTSTKEEIDDCFVNADELIDFLCRTKREREWHLLNIILHVKQATLMFLCPKWQEEEVYQYRYTCIRHTAVHILDDFPHEVTSNTVRELRPKYLRFNWGTTCSTI